MKSSYGYENSDIPYFYDDPDYLSEGKSKKRLSSLPALIIFTVIGTFFIQNTLAANISLNSGARVEFGQGIQQTTACSGTTQILMTPYATFTNATGAGSFKFSSITVSNIPAGCHGSDFTINAYDNSGNTPLAIFNSTSTSAVIYNDAGTFKAGVGSTGMTVTSGSGTFTATFTSPVALASSVSKITLQSGASSGLVYAVGDPGPGGGTVFYVANTPFACGPARASTCTYLEAAPSGWANGGTPANDPTKNAAIALHAGSDVAAITNSVGANNTSATIGLGYLHSIAIVDQGNNTTTAAGAARAYLGGGKNDWYVPTTAELNQMCKWMRGVAWTSDATICSGGTLNAGTGAAGFVANPYWSSTEYDGGSIWAQSFNDGNQGLNGLKGNNYYVRPIRAF
jgi:hypothetical protein